MLEFRVVWLGDLPAEVQQLPLVPVAPSTPSRNPTTTVRSPPKTPSIKPSSLDIAAEAVDNHDEGSVARDTTARELSASRIYRSVEGSLTNHALATALLMMTQCQLKPRPDPFDTGPGGRIFQIITRDSTEFLWSAALQFEDHSDTRMTTIPRPNVQNLLVVENLGSGADGAVVLACTQSSKAVCVIKFPHRGTKAGSLTTSDLRSALVAKEKKIWDMIYPEFKDMVSVGRWRGEDALVMPHLSQAVDRDEKAFSAIEATLDLFANKNVKHEDVRWANIGFYTNMERKLIAVLFDFAKIELPKDGETTAWPDTEKKRWVGKCMAALR